MSKPEPLNPATCILHGEALTRIEEALSNIISEQKNLNDKLFVGNGKPAVISDFNLRIDRVEQSHERQSKQMAWVMGIGATVVSALIVAGVIALAGRVHL